MWFWIALFAGLGSAVDKVIHRLALKEQRNLVAYSFLWLLFISLLSLGFSFPFILPSGTNFWGLVFLQVIFWSSATLAGFISQSKTDVSLTSIISRARMLWLIPLSFLFLGERLSGISIFGIFIIFGGFLVLFWRTKVHRDKGVDWMILGSLFSAFGTVVNVFLLRSYLGPAQVTFFQTFGQVILFLAILIYRKDCLSRLQEVWKRARVFIVSSATIETAAIIGNNQAIKLGPTSAVTAIYLSMTLATVWIGVIFLKERELVWKKVISSLIVTAGIIMVKVFS